MSSPKQDQIAQNFKVLNADKTRSAIISDSAMNNLAESTQILDTNNKQFNKVSNPSDPAVIFDLVERPYAVKDEDNVFTGVNTTCDILPKTDDKYNIGSKNNPTLRYKNIYAVTLNGNLNLQSPFKFKFTENCESDNFIFDGSSIKKYVNDSNITELTADSGGIRKVPINVLKLHDERTVSFKDTGSGSATKKTDVTGSFKFDGSKDVDTNLSVKLSEPVKIAFKNGNTASSTKLADLSFDLSERDPDNPIIVDVSDIVNAATAATTSTDEKVKQNILTSTNGSNNYRLLMGKTVSNENITDESAFSPYLSGNYYGDITIKAHNTKLLKIATANETDTGATEVTGNGIQFTDYNNVQLGELNLKQEAFATYLQVGGGRSSVSETLKVGYWYKYDDFSKFNAVYADRCLIVANSGSSSSTHKASTIVIGSKDNYSQGKLIVRNRVVNGSPISYKITFSYSDGKHKVNSSTVYEKQTDDNDVYYPLDTGRLVVVDKDEGCGSSSKPIYINARGVAQVCGDFNAMLSGSKTTIFEFTDTASDHPGYGTSSNSYYVYYDASSGTTKLSSSYKSTKIDLRNYKNRMLSFKFIANLSATYASGQTEIVSNNSSSTFRVMSSDSDTAKGIPTSNGKVIITKYSATNYGNTTIIQDSARIDNSAATDGTSTLTSSSTVHGGAFEYTFYNTYDYIYIRCVVIGHGDSYNNVLCNISTAIVSWE